MIAATSGSALAQPTGKPDKAQLAEAKKHMEAGAAFYNDPSGTPKCEEAYGEFKKAYDLSGSLKALKALGICALILERDGDAIERYEKYLSEKGSPSDAADRKQVESDLKALKAAVAKVTLKSDRPNARITDVRTPSSGSPVTNDYALSGEQTFGIHPGRHTFTASVDGAAPLTWSTEIANGGTYEHTFDFSKAAPATTSGTGSQTGGGPASSGIGAGNGEQPLKTQPTGTERPVPVSVFVVGGLSAALAVPTVIFMVRAKGKNSDYETQNGKLPAATLETLRSDVKRANLIADVFLGATIAGAAATTILYFTRPTRPIEGPKAGLTFAPVVGRSGGGALLMGRF